MLCILGLIFCLFPYTQIFELETYTQPYALIFSAMAAVACYPFLLQRFPPRDAVILTFLAAVGVVGLLATCMPNPDAQEFKYLLSYVSPLVFALASFATVSLYPQAADRVICAAAGVWIFVGVVQTIVDPGFATQFVGTFGESAGDVVDSGRGTLGLAPEPTHFGFHMIILATALAMVGGRNVFSLLCLATAILVARSSSALLALILGSIIYVAFFTKRARFLLLLAFPAYFMIGMILDSNLLPEDMRLVYMMRDFYRDPLYALTSEGSANARLGGIWVGAKQIFDNLFLPHGMDHATWTGMIGPIMASNPWLLMLSETGIPSGILIIVFQMGFLGLIPMVMILRRMTSDLHSHYETLLISAIIFVFFSQYMISTPGFGLIYGILLARRVNYASALDRAARLRAAASSIPAGPTPALAAG